MHAIEIVGKGGPEALSPATRPVPKLGPTEVLIKVAAAGINRPDVMQRQGRYPPPPGVTDIPGLEAAGTVAAVGAGVKRWRPGDEVCALVAGGGYAEYLVAPAPQVLPVPAGLSFVQAAALPETTFTVWTNLFEKAALATGERVLIHGGSGGIGTTAIQLAHAFGAEVFTTAGSDEKCAACRELGADVAINHKTQNFGAVVTQATDGQGVDVILDMVGGGYVQRGIDILRPGGRLILISFLLGSKATLDLTQVLRNRLTLFGSTLRARPVAEKGAIASSVEQSVWPLLAAGRIAPVIDSTFPLDQAARAHAHMEAGNHFGKIVLTVP
jgi:putative PIG3 family NAD(P)H quinone oxidoreductase